MKIFNQSISKSTMTDSISVALIGIGLAATTPITKPILYTGLFAFSGAITNQVAIYMLFNKVPFLYGSGVIEDNFENFKASIKDMMMKQFFNKEQLTAFFQSEEKKINLIPLVENSDFSPAFNALKQSVMESKLGDMLNLFGGEKALDSLREPFVKKLQSAVVGIVSSDTFQNHLSSSVLNDDILKTVEELITNRLNELTPTMVNDLVHELIHTHLGWLVVWGGIFGGLIGLGSSFLL